MSKKLSAVKDLCEASSFMVFNIRLLGAIALLGLVVPGFVPGGGLALVAREAIAQSFEEPDEETHQTINELLQQGFQYLYTSQLEQAIATFQQTGAQYQQQGDRAGEAAALLGQSEAYLWSWQFEDQLTTAQQALEIYQALQDRSGEAAALHQIGDAQLNLGQTDDGVATLQQALAIRRDVQDRQGEGWTLGLLGIGQVKQGNSADGLPTLQQAIAILNEPVEAERQLEQDYRRGVILAWLGNAQVQQNQLELATETLQQALELGRTIGNRSVEDLALEFNAARYEKQNQPEAALDAYQQVLTLREQQGNPTGQGWALYRVAGLYGRQGQYSDALASYQRALSLFESIEDQAAQGEVFFAIAGLYEDQEQYPEAIANFERSLAIFQSLDSYASEVNILNSIGYAYVNNHQYEQARPFFQQQVELGQQNNDPINIAFGVWGVGDTYGNYAQWLYGNGEYTEAIAIARQAVDLYEQALASAKAADFGADLTSSLISNLHIASLTQGHSFNQLQQPPDAIAAFQQSLEVLETYRDQLPNSEYSDAQMGALMMLGLAYSNNGQNLDALESYQRVEQVATQIDNTEYQFRSLSLIFSTQRSLGNYTEALATAQRLLSIVHEHYPDDAASEIGVLIKLGQAYGNLAQYPAELEQYQRALTLARELNDINKETTILNNMAVVYSAQGRYPQFLEVQQQVIALRQQAVEQIQTDAPGSFEKFCSDYSTDDVATRQQCLEMYRYGLAVSLNNLVSAYESLGRYSEALTAFEQALAIAQEYKALELESSLLLNVGNVHGVLGAYDKALTIYERALEIGTTTANVSTQIVALNNIARVYDDQGRYPEALEFFQRSLELAQDIGALDAEATVLNNVGSIYDTQGRNSEALAAYQQSLEISQELGIDITNTLNNIAVLESGQGRSADALDKLQQALAIVQESGARQMEAVVLSNIAIVYSDRADFATAIDLNQQSLAIRQEIGAKPSEIFGLVALGRSYHELGQYEKALELQQQALALSREIGARPQEAFALANIGRTYLYQKQYAQALTFYEQGLQIAREIGDVGTEAGILDAIGRVYEQQEQFDRAIETYQQALILERETANILVEAETLRGLGVAYAAQGQDAQALESFQQALAIQRQVETPSGEAQTLASLGQYFANQEQPELAIAFYKQSVNVIESIRQNLSGLPQEQQESYTETVANTYRQLADLLLQQDRVLEAQQVLDLLKVQELDDYLHNVRGSETTEEGIPNRPPEQEIENALNNRLNEVIALTRELQTLEAIHPNDRTDAQQARIQDLGQRASDLIAGFNQFWSSEPIQEQVALLRQNTGNQSLDLSNYRDLQRSLSSLQQNAVLLYPFVLENRLELVLVTPDADIPLRETVEVDRVELNEAIANYRSALEDPTSNPLPLAQQLYEWMLKPLEDDLEAIGAETIIYAPDGQLRYIPLGALHDGDQWVTEQFRINNITAASLMDLTLLPNQEPRVLAAAFTEGSFPLAVGDRQETFSGLPYAGQEVETLATLIPDTTTKLNQEFNTDTIPAMNSYSIVHLATHAAFVPGNPSESFILFGDGTPISLSDISQWRLPNVDLVVLSACETGVGDELGDGREILGLGYQMQLVGAKAAIASLWSVNDGGTQVLMNAFYRALNEGMTKTEALQQAQIALITGDLAAVGDVRGNATIEFVSAETGLPAAVSNNLDHPYYWAPFILIGNGL